MKQFPLHHLAHVYPTIAMLKAYGVKHVVLSPGSRSAPLTMAVAADKQLQWHVHLDERCAGYFALGLIKQTNEPVAVITTSGTAAINLYPSITEAYYQQLPLIVITADRPEELIDQMDGQTIRQTNLFANHCKDSYSFPSVIVSEDQEQLVVRKLNHLLSHALNQPQGPIHLNIPFKEPLYEDIPVDLFWKKKPLLQSLRNVNQLNDLLNKWNNADFPVFVVGQLNPTDPLIQSIKSILSLKKGLAFADGLSNLKGENVITETDLILASPYVENFPNPDFVISVGGPVLSKRLKSWLRKLNLKDHVVIGSYPTFPDTYNNATVFIDADPRSFIEQINKVSDNAKSAFKLWNDLQLNVFEKKSTYLKSISFSELKAMDFLAENIPEKSLVEFASSMPVRYGMWCSFFRHVVQSNRGTSGIDGCLSTAIGMAKGTSQTVWAIIGDTAFVYDSNALLTKPFPKNLRVIMMDNSGGNIFGMIDGPQKSPHFDKIFMASPNYDPINLCKAFGLKARLVDNSVDLKEEFRVFLKGNFQVLVIKTDFTENELALKGLFKLMTDLQ